MAENKKSFILYCDLIHTVKKMPIKKAGELFLTILEYVNDLNPEVNDLAVGLVFEPIKHQLKRDLKEWDVIREDRSAAGKLGNLKRWNKDLYDKVIKKEISVANAEIIAKDRKAIQTVANIAVTVTDNVNVNGSVLAATPEIEKIIEDCLDIAMKDERWVRVNKVSKNDLQEFNKLLEKRGRYTKNPADYKEHYANWKKGGKKESYFETDEPKQNFNGHMKSI